MDKRLRDTLSGLNLGSRPRRGSEAPGRADRSRSPCRRRPRRRRRPKLSSGTDVDRILSDTLSGITSPEARPPAASDAAVARRAPRPLRQLRRAPRRPRTRRRAEPAAAVPATGPDRFGQYEILERIASGGMAEVYKAKRTGVEGFQKIVAIKKILPHLADDDEFITMFVDEAKLAAQLNHPNIIQIFDLGQDPGRRLLHRDGVRGRPGPAGDRAGGARALGVPLPVPLAVYIASKVASALDYAHRRRDADGHALDIVHRDVSPQNILISYEGEVKLFDFGIAKAASKASKTQAGALKGKFQYMSPEQAWGKPIDRRSDLFSLGRGPLRAADRASALPRRHRHQRPREGAQRRRRAALALEPRSPAEPRRRRAQGARAGARRPLRERVGPAARPRVGPLLVHAGARQRRRRDLPPPAAGRGERPSPRRRRARSAQAGARGRSRRAEARSRKARRSPAHRRGTPVPRARAAAEPPAGARAGADAAPRAAAGHGAREVFGSLEKPAEAEEEPHAALIAAVAVAAGAAVGFVIWKCATPQAGGPAGARTRTAAATRRRPPRPSPRRPCRTAAPRIDPKAVEAEVQRQLAAQAQGDGEGGRRGEEGRRRTRRPPRPPGAAAPSRPAAPTIPPTAVPTRRPPFPTEPPPPPDRARRSSAAAAPNRNRS